MTIRRSSCHLSIDSPTLMPASLRAFTATPLAWDRGCLIPTTTLPIPPFIKALMAAGSPEEEEAEVRDRCDDGYEGQQGRC